MKHGVFVIPTRIESDVRELILSILQKEKERRPTLQQIMGHRAVRRYAGLFSQPLTAEDLKLLARNFRINSVGEEGRYCPKFVKEMTSFPQTPLLRPRQLAADLGGTFGPGARVAKQPAFGLPTVVHKVYTKAPETVTVDPKIPRRISGSLSPNRVTFAQQNSQFSKFNGELVALAQTRPTQQTTSILPSLTLVKTYSVSHFVSQKPAILETQHPISAADRKTAEQGNEDWFEQGSVSSFSGNFAQKNNGLGTPIKRAVNFLNSAQTDPDQSSKNLQIGESSADSQHCQFSFSRYNTLVSEAPVRRSLLVSSPIASDLAARSQEPTFRHSNRPYPPTLSRQPNTASANDLTSPKTSTSKLQNTRFVNAIPPFYLLNSQLNTK